MGRKAELLELINNVRSTGLVSIIRRALTETVEACLPDDPPEVDDCLVSEVIPVVEDTAAADGGRTGDLVEQDVVPPAPAADPEVTPESPSVAAAVVSPEPVAEPVAEPAPVAVSPEPVAEPAPETAPAG